MELHYKLTCNPWADRGAIVLADQLEVNDSIVEEVIVNEGEIAARFYPNTTPEQASAALAEILHNREQSLYVPNSLARTLTAMGRNVAKTDAEGRKSTRLMVNVTQEELPELKKRKLTSIKAGENKIYRLTASYPVAEQDVSKLFENSQVLADQVIEEMEAEQISQGSVCSLGGDCTKHLESLTQSLHIFANKHHNASVRGYSRGNGYFRAGATWRYALALSATEAAHPFFETRDQGTTLLMPVVEDFKFLRRLHRHLQAQLADINKFESHTSSTNLRDLYQPGTYSGLVTLLHCLRNPLTITDKKNRIEAEEIPRLTRWMTSQFRRAKNVNFGSFHTIEVDHRLFEYVKPLMHTRHGDTLDFQVIRDVFNKVKWPDTSIAERFSHALVVSSTPFMKSVLWEMYKDRNRFSFYNQKGQPAVCSLLESFIEHFLKVNTKDIVTSMTPEIRNAAKHLGKLVGKAFDDDLTLLSRVYNIHTPDELREVIKTVMFRLEKLAVAQSRKPNDQKNKPLHRVYNEPFEILLDAINNETYREIADVFSIFASLNAFNANVSDKTEDQIPQDTKEDNQ